MSICCHNKCKRTKSLLKMAEATQLDTGARTLTHAHSHTDRIDTSSHTDSHIHILTRSYTYSHSHMFLH